MRILRLSPAQREFMLVDVLDFYMDEDDAQLRETAAMAADHIGRAHGGGLPVYNPQVLYDMVLERTNAIDDALEAGEAMRRYTLTPKQARAAVRTGTAITRKLLPYLR